MAKLFVLYYSMHRHMGTMAGAVAVGRSVLGTEVTSHRLRGSTQGSRLSHGAWCRCTHVTHAATTHSHHFWNGRRRQARPATHTAVVI